MPCRRHEACTKSVVRSYGQRCPSHVVDAQGDAMLPQHLQRFVAVPGVVQKLHHVEVTRREQAEKRIESVEILIRALEVRWDLVQYRAQKRLQKCAPSKNLVSGSSASFETLEVSDLAVGLDGNRKPGGASSCQPCHADSFGWR